MNALSPETPYTSVRFLEAFHYAQRGMGVRIMMGRFRFLHRDRKWRESIQIAHSFADKYVDQALEYRKVYLEQKRRAGSNEGDVVAGDPQERYVLLKEMAKETDNRVELRNQILHVFLAGHDSTAITIGNAIFQLSRDQDRWEKLRGEALSIGDTPLTFEILKDMHYLQYIIKESKWLAFERLSVGGFKSSRVQALRLYPVAPGDSRIVYHDTVLPTGGGSDGTSPILVSAGQTVVSNTYALHRRSEYWGSDTEGFRPERWETCRPGWHYQPFGGGPRMCPGQNLALTEAAYVLVRMAQEYKRCECRDDVLQWVEEMKITASSKNGVKVGLTAA